MNAWGISLWLVICSWSVIGQPLTPGRLAGAPTDSLPDRIARYQRSSDGWGRTYEDMLTLAPQLAAREPKQSGSLGFAFLNQWYDYPRAIQYFDMYDALTPNFEDVFANNPVSYLRGLAYQKMNSHERAIEQMSCGIDAIAVKHGSEWVNYRYFINRAVSYLALQQPEKALADLDKAIQNFNRSPMANYYRGQALRQLNRCAEAKLAFLDASFFLKALRVERRTEQEDDYNPVCEEQIDAALAELK